jgi:hypothetical protein
MSVSESSRLLGVAFTQRFEASLIEGDPDHIGRTGSLASLTALLKTRGTPTPLRTDRIGDIVVGQAAAGAQNGGRDLETTFGRNVN